MHNITRRLVKIEKQLNVSEKPPVVFEYTDENGVEQKIEMSSDDFDKLLKEISEASKGPPIREGVGI